MDKLTFNTQEVADLLGISRSYAYEMIRQGEIPSMCLGKHKRIIPQQMFFKWLSEKSGCKKELENGSFFDGKKEEN